MTPSPDRASHDAPQASWPSELVYRAGDRLIVYKIEAFDLPARVRVAELRALVKIRHAEEMGCWWAGVTFCGLEVFERYLSECGREGAVAVCLADLITDLRHYGVEVVDEEATPCQP